MKKKKKEEEERKKEKKICLMAQRDIVDSFKEVTEPELLYDR